MPRPRTIPELIDPADMRFPEHWRQEFGRYQWFHIAGYRDHMTRAGIFNHSDVKRFASEVKPPKEWRDYFPEGDWDGFATMQVDNAIRPFRQEYLNGRLIRVCKPMRLDKACLAILCLEEAVKAAPRSFDIYESIRIRPALFLVDGFSMPTTGIQELLAATGQVYKEVLTDLADGAPVTGLTANLLQSNLKSGAITVVSGRKTVGRQAKRPLTPNRYEIINFVRA